jgi:serine phosphatase RsbU (regulator of sigma subunit)/Flp pilus assembly protein TadD
MLSKNILIAYLFLLFPLFGRAQSYEKDSLWNVWQDETKADTTRLRAIHKIAWNIYLFTQPDSALYYVQFEYNFAQKVKSLKYIGVACNTMGIAKSILGKNDEALEHFKEALAVDQKAGNIKGVSVDLNNMGIIYKEQGKYNLALEVFTKSLEIDRYQHNKKGQGSSLNNMGIVYELMDNHERAIDSYMQTLSLRREARDSSGISSCLNNIGIVYHDKKDFEKALEYYQDSFSYKDTVHDKQGVSISYHNYANIYRDIGEFDKALYYYEESYELKKTIGSRKGMFESLNGIGAVYFNQGYYEKAIKYGEEAFEIAQQIEVLVSIQEVSLNLFRSYKKVGRSRKALEMYELYNLMTDSLNTKENQKALLQKELQFEYEKEKAVTEKEKERVAALSEKEKEKQKILKYTMGGGLLLVVLFLFFVFNRLKATNKKNKIIAEQKEKVDEAFLILEEKNKEITDSITYAKRIQSAILPSDGQIHEFLPSSFVLYEPKDIVAGDFYWLEPLEDSVLFAVADCTGHGVPGAMVSVVSINALNRSVRELGLKEPGKILDQTRKIVVHEFSASMQVDKNNDHEVKDGMDIALCRIKGDTLEYAGAYNPLWVVRKHEILEFKATKQPIGAVDNPKLFSTISIELEKGDCIYIFSDGFADQFGGAKGKKYKYKPFKKLIVDLHQHSMADQKTKILDEFNKWRGDLEQVDDVCMIGIRH